MAKHERRKEDLIADATALVNRAEFLAPHLDEALVAGFRENGALSLYFGEDPVYHFNPVGELRRAYVAGDLFRAEKGNLIRLVRHRQVGEHQLRSRQLAPEEQTSFVAELTARLAAMARQFSSESVQTGRQVSVDALEVADLLRDWLAIYSDSVSVAESSRL